MTAEERTKLLRDRLAVLFPLAMKPKVKPRLARRQPEPRRNAPAHCHQPEAYHPREMPAEWTTRPDAQPSATEFKAKPRIGPHPLNEISRKWYETRSAGLR